jgi:hypothetical protein
MKLPGGCGAVVQHCLLREAANALPSGVGDSRAAPAWMAGTARVTSC